MSGKGRTVKANLRALVDGLEEKRGSSYTIEEIARGANLSRQTVKAWLDGNVKGTNFDTIQGLLNYLDGQGLTVGIQDLLILEPGDQVPA